MLHLWSTLVLFLALTCECKAEIDRESIVRHFNIKLNASHPYSPVQVGNGNFAFGADITGLQTFLPHNTLSSWGWHNSSLPSTPNQTSVSDYTGVEWWTHGRLVPYAQPNPKQKDISQWLIANPHRFNLGRIGLWFKQKNITEGTLVGKKQVLYLWDGLLNSTFELNGAKVEVQTAVHPESDTVGVHIASQLVSKGELGAFFDYPYASGKNKFDAPFVGVWNATANHTTTLSKMAGGATIKHTLDATEYTTGITWGSAAASIVGPENGSHRYILRSGPEEDVLSFVANFALGSTSGNSDAKARTWDELSEASSKWWNSYWKSGAFVSLPLNNTSATELQRRVILSQYLLAVNGAGKDPPQESGLVNNGWYGKFHMEMVFWHLSHWAIWNKWSLLDRGIPVYSRFLATSMERAQAQGYQGARFGKMSDPSGRSAPGEINSLLIWQQPHPMYFAELEWRKYPTDATLKKWDNVLTAAADFMASYAWWNETTKVYDLGPPMYPVSENTNPNQTVNPTFELAYWRFGLNVAAEWQKRQGKQAPERWTHVKNNLAKFPVQNDVYVLYEGVKNPWTTPSLAEDHPGLLGIYGWLPPDSRFNLTTFNKTVDKVYQSWNFTYSYGWDFPLLAMTAARMGDADKAVKWLLDANNQFDGVGMPVGGTRVATPYFPASAGLLLAVGMMSGGWDGLPGPVFPKEWKVEVENFVKAM